MHFALVLRGEVCVLDGGCAFPVPPNHIIYNELTRICFDLVGFVLHTFPVDGCFCVAGRAAGLSTIYSVETSDAMDSPVAVDDIPLLPKFRDVIRRIREGKERPSLNRVVQTLRTRYGIRDSSTIKAQLDAAVRRHLLFLVWTNGVQSYRDPESLRSRRKYTVDTLLGVRSATRIAVSEIGDPSGSNAEFVESYIRQSFEVKTQSLNEMVLTSLYLLAESGSLVRAGGDRFKIARGTHIKRRPVPEDEESNTPSEIETVNEETPARQKHSKRKGSPLRQVGGLADNQTDDGMEDGDMTGSDSDSLLDGSCSSQAAIDADEIAAENSSTPRRERCPDCPFIGHGFPYDRHMRGHRNDFALKCQVPGCGWTNGNKSGMAMHTRMHKSAAAAASGTTTPAMTETPQQRTHSTHTISRTVEPQRPLTPPLLGPPPSNPDIPSVYDYSSMASTWKQYEEVGYMHVETSVKEGWTKEKLIPLSGVKGRSLDICRLKWTSGLKSIPIWQLKDSDEFLAGVPFSERTAGELRFVVQDCGAMRIDPPGVEDGSWFERYVRPGMSDGQFLRTRPHMAGLNSYMYEPTLNGHFIRRAIEQDAKLKTNKTIQQIIEISYKKQLSIPLLLRKQIHDVNFWSTSGDVLFFSAHPNAYYEQIDDPFILSSLKDRNDLMRHKFPLCSKYGPLSSYPINIHTFGGRFEEIMLNWIAGPGLTIEWLYVNTSGTGTPFHHEPGGLASVNQNLGIIPPEGAVQTHPSSKIWTINYPAAYADFTHVMTSTGGEGNEYKLAYLSKEGGISRGLTNAVFPTDNRPCTTTEQPVGSFVYLAPGVLRQVDNTGPTMSVARNIIDQLWIESGHIFIDQILGCDAKNPGGILGCCYKEAEEQAIRDNYKLRLDLQNRPEEFTTYMTARTLMRCRTQDEKIAARMDFELLEYMGRDWIEADKTILGLDSVVSQGEVCVLENGGGAFPVPPNHIIYNELTRKKYYPTDHRH